MFFKNLQIYRLAAGWAMSPGSLEEELAKRPLWACSGINLQSKGWVAPREAPLVESYQKQLMIALGVEQKLLPSSVVNDEARPRRLPLHPQLVRLNRLNSAPIGMSRTVTSEAVSQPSVGFSRRHWQ